MTSEEAVEFLADEENAEVVRLALEKVCRERPAWWVRFLERESRIRGMRGRF